MTNKSYFPALTGLRFVAALFIFIHHLTPVWLPKPLFDFFQEFHIGVPIFFVLSGFLIGYRYYDNVELKQTWLKNFFINRVARIYPLYFIITVISVFFFKEGGLALFMNLTFLRGFFGDYIFTGVHQGWSLTVEECFYILAPFMFVLSARIKLVFQLLFFLSIGVLLTTFAYPQSWHQFLPNYFLVLSYTFFGRCFEFFAGIQLALWFKDNSKLLNTKFNKTYAGITGILMIAFLLAEIKGAHRWGVHRYSGIFINNWILPFFICLLISGLLTENTILKQFLQKKNVVLLGKSSYAFYLIHYGMWHMFVKAFITQNFFLELVLTTTLSIIVYKAIEEPANRYFRKFKTQPHFPGNSHVISHHEKSTIENPPNLRNAPVFNESNYVKENQTF